MLLYISDLIWTHANAAFHIADAVQGLPDSVKEIFSDSSEITLLKEQISFFKSANSELTSGYRSLNQSFTAFTSTINIIFLIAAALFTAITGSISFFGFQAIKKTVDQLVEKEVNKELSRRLEERFEYLERLAQREGILDFIKVGYYLPDSDATKLAEFLALSRRFKRVTHFSKMNTQMFNSNVVVFDVENAKTPEEERKAEIEKIAKDAKPWVVLVIYTQNNQSPLVTQLRSLALSEGEKIEYAPANTKVTLIERVENAAYVSEALQKV